MKIIKLLVEDIQEELDSSEHYAKLATQYKDEDRALADNYAKMAGVELEHVNALHDQAVRLIKDYRSAGNEPPTSMKAVWDYEHQRAIDKTAKVKTLLNMYRGS